MNFRKSTSLLLVVMFLASCSVKKGPEHFYFGNYSEAETLYNEGVYEEAIAKYLTYIDENPEGNLAVISRYYIAKSHVALGQSTQARQIFELIIREHPDLVWANFSETQLKELQDTPSS